MTVLDTFYILFKTNADEVKRGMDTVNKVAKETEEKLKNTNEEAAKLGSTFVKMVEGGAELAGMYSAFNMIKAGVIGQRDYNAQLYTTSVLYKQNAGALKEFAQAAIQAGGSREGAMQDMMSYAQTAGVIGGKYDPLEQMKAARARYQSLSNSPVAQRQMLTGPNAYYQDPGMQMMLAMSNDKFNALLNTTGVQAAASLTPAQAKTAFESKAKGNELDASVGELNTTIGTALTPAINKLIDVMSNVASNMGGSIYTAIYTAGAFILGKGLLTGALGRGIAGTILRGGAAAAAAEGGVTAASVAGAGLAGAGALAAGAGTVAVGAASLYGGYKLGGYLMEKSPFERMVTEYLTRDLYKGGGLTHATRGANDMDFWMKQGYSKEGAAGWVANMMRESGGNAASHHMDTDGKMHYGLFQWSPARRKFIKDKFGIDVATASKEDQLRAAALEAGSMGINKGMSGLGAYDSGAYLSKHFEMPGNGAMEAAMRGNSALSIAGKYRSPVTVGNANITISAININAPGADAKEIAKHIKAATKSTLSTIQAQADNGRAG